MIRHECLQIFWIIWHFSDRSAVNDRLPHTSRLPSLLHWGSALSWGCPWLFSPFVCRIIRLIDQERLLGFYCIIQSSIQRNLRSLCRIWLCSEIQGHFSQRHTATGPRYDQLLHWCSYSVPTGTDHCYRQHRVYVLPSSCSCWRFWCPTFPLVAWEWSGKSTWRVSNESSFIWCSVFSKLCKLSSKVMNWQQLATIWLWGNQHSQKKLLRGRLLKVRARGKGSYPSDWWSQKASRNGRFQFNQMCFKLTRSLNLFLCLKELARSRISTMVSCPSSMLLRYIGMLNLTSFVSRLKLNANPSQEEGYFQLFARCTILLVS